MSKPRKILTLQTPAKKAGCVIADNPHSGREYPADFNAACAPADLRQAEDAYLDKIISFLPRIGVPLLSAEFPRSYIDVNRRDDVTHKLAKHGGRTAYAPQKTGLIRAEIAPRLPVKIYARDIPLSEAFNRLSRCYKPYHRMLKHIADETAKAQGRVILLDFHSMPSVLMQGARENAYDIILGTMDGKTTDPAHALKLKNLFEAKGYTVGMNVEGFRGREIIARHGHPAQNRHAIQVEINRKLYLDEKNVCLKPADAQKISNDLEEIIKDFVADVGPKKSPPQFNAR